MPTLAVGSPEHSLRWRRWQRAAGFTLIELLVVIAIVALASAGVGFALRDSTQVQLEREGERLSALLESARARSRLTGVPVWWHSTAEGFRFEGPDAQPLPQADLPQRWLDPDTSASSGPDAAADSRLLLGPDPIIEPQKLELHSRAQPGKRVRLVSDGIHPFALQVGVP